MTEYCRPEPGFFNGCGQFSDCDPNLLGKYQCYHWSAFDVDAAVIFIYILIPLFIGCGMLGGLGGGIIKGPVLEMMLNYPLSEATHIASCFNFGGSFINTILLLFERKPDEPNRSIIDFWISVVFNLGIPWATYFGSKLATLMPQLYVLIFQEIFLFVVIPILWSRAMQQKEREALAKKADKEDQERVAKALNKVNDSGITNDSQLVEAPEDPLYKRLRLESQQRFPYFPIILIVMTSIINQLITEMRSTKNYQSYIGLNICTTPSNLVFALLIVINIIWSSLVYFFGRRREILMDKVNFRPQDRYFTPITKFAKIYIGGIGAGFMSGFLQMGAGMIMVPVMLEYDFIARCAAATSAFNYFMISLNNYIPLLLNKFLDWQYLLLFTGLAVRLLVSQFLGGSIFTKIGYILMNKYKIGYVVIYFVLSLAFANVISQVYYGVVTGERYGFSLLKQPNRLC